MQQGVKVTVGLIETHGRAETEALLQGFTILPRREVDYHSQKLTEFDLDAALAAKFAPLAKTLTDSEATIVEELNAVQGKPVDIGGYYHADPELTSKAMRPSATFNAALAALA